MVIRLRRLLETTDVPSQIVLTDPTISNVHIRIYSIRYDPDVEPFVYAENLSLNGVAWLHQRGTKCEAFPIAKGKAVLLSNGDKIKLCDRTTFTFETRLPPSQLLTSTQLQEKENPDCRQVLEKAVSASTYKRELMLIHHPGVRQSLRDD